MAVAAAPTPAGEVHPMPAEAGHPSPTAGLRCPTGHRAIARGNLLRRGAAVTDLAGTGRRRWCGICAARTDAGGGYAKYGHDGYPRDQLLHLHVHGATPVL